MTEQSTSNTSLESKVREEIDTWNISLGKIAGRTPVYAPFTRPLLYGVGIGVADKVLDRLKVLVGAVAPLKYLEMGYPEARKAFIRDYLYINLARHDYSVTETALGIGLSENVESARTWLANILRQETGHSAREIKRHPELVEAVRNEVLMLDAETREGLVAYAKDEVQKYAPHLPHLVGKLIQHNAQRMAERLVHVAESVGMAQGTWELLEVPYHEVVKQFEKWYLAEQIRIGGNGRKAAERAGVGYDSFRQLLYTRGMKVGEILSEGFTETGQ